MAWSGSCSISIRLARPCPVEREKIGAPKRERHYEILPIRRQIPRQPFPAQRVNDRICCERTGALLAVRHERLAGLRHFRDGVFGGLVLRFDELGAGDGPGVVGCVGFLEVWLGWEVSGGGFFG